MNHTEYSDTAAQKIITNFGQLVEKLTRELYIEEQKTKKLRSALSAMLTHMGMDEDEWNKPTFDQAREALKETEWIKRRSSEFNQTD